MAPNSRHLDQLDREFTSSIDEVEQLIVRIFSEPPIRSTDMGHLDERLALTLGALADKIGYLVWDTLEFDYGLRLDDLPATTLTVSALREVFLAPRRT